MASELETYISFTGNKRVGRACEASVSRGGFEVIFASSGYADTFAETREDVLVKLREMIEAANLLIKALETEPLPEEKD